MVGPILVTGGAGQLGRLVVRRLLAGGAAEVRVGSRRERPTGDHSAYGWARADLRSGVGVPEAVAGAEVIVHCATTAIGRRSEEAVTGTLVEAAKRAGRPHLVYISIVGIDRVPFGYYQGKLASERVIEASGLPYTILRATQFHDLLRTVFAITAKAPVMAVPDLPFQPIDTGEVGARLAELALGEPAGRVPDIGGPQVLEARDLAASYLLSTGLRRPVLPIRLPGKVFRAYRAGGHTTPDHTFGTISFEDYLAAHPDPRRGSYRARG
ncbi:MAG TPA: SDR family oxidoreductase [Pseudonocardiaceae bacterium]|jgi:uncharacterized protein YbjT (DUF2867 family)|nr:SDR family oxidoreductase [Pseudonocardiaceae bacterium]